MPLPCPTPSSCVPSSWSACTSRRHYARKSRRRLCDGDRRQRRSRAGIGASDDPRLRRSEEHTSELQSLAYLVCRLLLEKKKSITFPHARPENLPFERQDASIHAVH